MNVVKIYIPNEIGISNSNYTYYGGSNAKSDIIKNFILENIQDAVVLSDNNPDTNVAREINIALTDYFVINIKSIAHSTGALYGRTECTMKGIDGTREPIGEKLFLYGYLYFYENNDFFGLGEVLRETFMINKQRKTLFYNYLNLYKTFNQVIPYEGHRGLYTVLSSSNKARLIQPSITTEGAPMSQYLFSISNSEIAALGIDGAVTNQMRLLRDEDNNVWGLLNTLLFK